MAAELTYGNCHVLEPNFADDPDGQSDYENPYFFQGKRLDLLDDGGLELMSWPYRDYSPYLGRWLQAEKLGMIPNDHSINSFSPRYQHAAGMNYYEYVSSNPVIGEDLYGLVTAERCQELYARRVSSILGSFNRCLSSCPGPISVGAEVGLCVIACARAGAYAPACIVGCVGGSTIIISSCHIMCARLSNRDLENARRARDFCFCLARGCSLSECLECVGISVGPAGR